MPPDVKFGYHLWTSWLGLSIEAFPTFPLRDLLALLEKTYIFVTSLGNTLALRGGQRLKVMDCTDYAQDASIQRGRDSCAICSSTFARIKSFPCP
jgi:hypothetical protein